MSPNYEFWCTFRKIFPGPFECILATGFLFEIQQSKKQLLFILTAFSRSEISKMIARCSNNDEFLHQKVPLNTQRKTFPPRLIWKNLSNTAINFFLQKKQLIEITSCFTHNWVISLSRTSLLKSLQKASSVSGRLPTETIFSSRKNM